MFRKSWTETVLTEVIEGSGYGNSHHENTLLYAYANSGDIPTKNIAAALQQSGISEDGRLPEGALILLNQYL